MRFTKMHVLGNDCICVLQNENINYNLKMFSKFLCDRHYGIGADVFVLIGKSYIADIKIRCFAKNGGECDANINAIVCAAKLMYEENHINKNIIYVETVAGIRKVELVLENNKIMNIRVDCGKLLLNCKKNMKKFLFKIRDKEVIGVGIPYGNYNIIIETNNLNEIDIEKYGRVIENYKYFLNKTNVEFMQIISKNNIKLKSWQKETGNILASGNGAVLSACCAFNSGKVNNRLTVETEGGNLDIFIDENESKIYLQVDAIIVFFGEIDF